MLKSHRGTAEADGRTYSTVREESSVVNNYRQLSDTIQPLPYNRVDNALPLYGALCAPKLIACEI